MKTLYFIRHGETHHNRAWIHQHALVPLSARGRSQARLLGKRFKNIKVDVVLSSDTTRAAETAQFVSEATKAPIEFSAGLEEYRRASSVVGRSYLHPKSLYSIGLSVLWAANPEWSFEDGETATELRLRAKRELEWILGKRQQHVAVVSHRLMIAAMMSELEDNFKQSFTDFMRDMLIANSMKNTAVTKVLFEDGPGDNDNVVIEYENDYSHLEK